MFFLDPIHEQNYNRLLENAQRKLTPQYKAACYIVSVPGIYEYIDGKPGTGPMDWTVEFDWAPETSSDGNSGTYQGLIPEYRYLVDLGRNLYNGYPLEPHHAQKTLPPNLYQVAKQALALRQGQEEIRE